MYKISNNTLGSLNSCVSPFVVEPGDIIIQKKMPGGDVITKINTDKLNATHRIYCKNDGTYGKQVLILKQIDNNN